MTLRTYGRSTNQDTGITSWVTVTSTPEGSDELVWFTDLLQALQLDLGESPFFGNVGIPVQETIASGIYPDFYVNALQNYYSPNFAVLYITRDSTQFDPTYDVYVQFSNGDINYLQITPPMTKSGLPKVKLILHKKMRDYNV
jgi:hypothetical protein